VLATRWSWRRLPRANHSRQRVLGSTVSSALCCESESDHRSFCWSVSYIITSSHLVDSFPRILYSFLFLYSSCFWLLFPSFLRVFTHRVALQKPKSRNDRARSGQSTSAFGPKAQMFSNLEHAFGRFGRTLLGALLALLLWAMFATRSKGHRY